MLKFISILIILLSTSTFCIAEEVETQLKQIFVTRDVDDSDPVSKYSVNEVLKKEWGTIISVYDQPSSQRITFESDTQITVIEMGLKWNPKTRTYTPSIKQVIELKKN
jgi:hypothetical protein